MECAVTGEVGIVPVVGGGVGGMRLDLGLAGGVEGGLLHVLLQAADDLGVAVLHVLAVALDVGAAGLLHGELEVDVLRHAHLLVKQRRLALVAQFQPPARTGITASAPSAPSHHVRGHASACMYLLGGTLIRSG